MVWVPLQRFYKLPNMPLAFAAQAGKLVPSKRWRWVQQCKVERPSKCRTFASRVGKRNCNETENLFLGAVSSDLGAKSCDRGSGGILSDSLNASVQDSPYDKSLVMQSPLGCIRAKRKTFSDESFGERYSSKHCIVAP